MEMPTTKHALCIWLTVAKFPSWFNAVLGERYNDWKAEFYRLYNLETIEDFELGWRDMVNSFGLHTNRHIASLYALRHLWALPYLGSHFFAGLTTPGQSKSINAFIQRFLSAQTRLAQFVEQVSSLAKLHTSFIELAYYFSSHLTPSCPWKESVVCLVFFFARSQNIYVTGFTLCRSHHISPVLLFIFLQYYSSYISSINLEDM